MLLLVRQAEIGGGTPGVIYFNGVDICSSLELPWKNNHRNISCIPSGKYPIQFTFSPHFHRKTIELMNVPGRSGIRIHAANYLHELKGCIAPCTEVETDQTETTIIGKRSLVALALLEYHVLHDDITEIEIYST